MSIEEIKIKNTAEQVFENLFGNITEKDINRINYVRDKTKFSNDMMITLIEYEFLMGRNKWERRELYECMTRTAELWVQRGYGVKEAREHIDESMKERNQLSLHQKMIKQEIEKEMRMLASTFTPVEKARVKAIRAAMNSGLDDTQLGKFVRTMFDEDI